MAPPWGQKSGALSSCSFLLYFLISAYRGLQGSEAASRAAFWRGGAGKPRKMCALDPRGAPFSRGGRPGGRKKVPSGGPRGLLAPPPGKSSRAPGEFWRAPGELLAPPGNFWRPPGGLLAPPWGLLAPRWGTFGAPLGTFGALLGAEKRRGREKSAPRGSRAHAPRKHVNSPKVAYEALPSKFPEPEINFI